MTFTVHSLESAPADSRPVLQDIVENYGFLPNLAAGLADSPAMLKGFLGLAASYEAADMTLSGVERQVVLLTASVVNGCDYCSAAHSMLAVKSGLDPQDVGRIVEGEILRDPGLEALRKITRSLVENRGWVEEEELEAFLRAGYDRSQVLEVLLGVTLKTLTNYANHLIDPEINEQFAAFAPRQAAIA